MITGLIVFAVSSLGGDESSEPAKVTFTQHVAPIIFNNCTSCHRPGEIGPFELLDYTDVRKRGKMIARVTEMRHMPPWRPVEGHGEFEDELYLSDREIDTIRQWVDGGMTEGPDEALPKMPEFTDGWQLGEPDMVVQMPEGYEVSAGGPDIYRNFVVPVDLPKDRYLTAIEVRPLSRAVLHHIIFSSDTTGEARRADGADGTPGFSGMAGVRTRSQLGQSTAGLGGWAVGGQPRHLPMGLGRLLPKGADIVLQSHFHPSGKKEVERTTLGLYFAKKKPKRTMVGLQMPPLFGASAGLDIPAGNNDFQLEESFELPVDVLALTVGGHAHHICKEMQIWATPPRGQKESIFYIDEWDFDWQNRYQYAEPLKLSAGTQIDASLIYDNSPDNAANPFDPPQRIRWGLQSTDEMGSVTLLLVARRESDTKTLQDSIRNWAVKSMAQGATRGRGGEGRGGRLGDLLGGMADRIRDLDKNGDGVIESDEIPQRFKRWAGRLDTNGDGVIDQDELDSLGGGEETEKREAPVAAPAPPKGPALMGIDGTEHHPLDTGKAKANVIVFTTVDCPIANSYAPELASLFGEFEDDPLNLFLVHVDPDTNLYEAKRHAEEYSLPRSILLDPSHELVRKIGATKTPEAAVVDAEGEVVYLGRIDNLYGDIGKKRQKASRRDLRAAILAVLKGRKILTPRTKAIGCDIPTLPAGG